MRETIERFRCDQCLGTRDTPVKNLGCMNPLPDGWVVVEVARGEHDNRLLAMFCGLACAQEWLMNEDAKNA